MLDPQLDTDSWTKDQRKDHKQCVRISEKTTLFAVFFEKLPLFTALLILTTMNIEWFFFSEKKKQTKTKQKQKQNKKKTDPFLQNLYFSYSKRWQRFALPSSETSTISDRFCALGVSVVRAKVAGKMRAATPMETGISFITSFDGLRKEHKLIQTHTPIRAPCV